MKRTFFGLTTAALLMTLAAVPAFAQERDARRREAARAEQNNQRQAQPPREAARSPEQPRRVEQARPRREDSQQFQAAVPRVQPPAVAPQAPVAAAPRVETRSNAVVGRAVPRTSAPSYY